MWKSAKEHFKLSNNLKYSIRSIIESNMSEFLCEIFPRLLQNKTKVFV